jgi:TonB family protein
METFSFYLFKSALLLSGFTMVYFLFLQNERFFTLKRVYLVAGMLASFILPLIVIHYQVEIPAPSSGNSVSAETVDTMGQAYQVTQPYAAGKSMNYRHLLFFLYIAGAFFFILVSSRNIIKILRAARRIPANRHGNVKLVRDPGTPVSFAFFNYVFINPSVDETDLEVILNHETVHVDQKHWLDLVLAELMKLIQWINPFVWIYTGYIRMNHEYLADEVALQRISDPARYKATLMNHIFGAQVISITNSLNYSLNKKRFDMMRKRITSPYRKFRLLFVLPVIAALLYAFAVPEYNYITRAADPEKSYTSPAMEQKAVKGIVLKEDGKPFAGVYITSTGTINNVRGATSSNDGRFSISDVSDDALILFNYKEYKQVALKPDYNSDMTVKMEKDPDYPKPRLVVVNGVATAETESLVLSKLTREEFELIKYVSGKEATDRYGEKGKNGVLEVTTTKKSPEQVQKEVKGIVVDEDGKPLADVRIMSTGTMGNSFMVVTSDGRFSIGSISENASLIFMLKGYKPLTLKPSFNSFMNVKMERDKEYKIPDGTAANAPSSQRQNPIMVIDGVISEKSFNEVRKDLGYNMGIYKMIAGKEAEEKYGEKGINGVVEIITRKKALEMGLKPSFPRLAPGDYPTFQNQKYSDFAKWVTNNARYPAEAKAGNLEGWVQVNYTVELDGTLSNVISTAPADPVLSDEIIRVVRSSPKWDPPKNPDVDEPFSGSLMVKFKLPDIISDEAPFVVVEKMPEYPGGDAALLSFITSNIKYPEEAKANKTEGRVIIRFIVSAEGKTEAPTVLKGVDPLLNAEAVRVISRLTGWKPGMQGGRPVNVWYMAPVKFSLAESEPLLMNTSVSELLKFVAKNVLYPGAAKNASDTGTVFAVLKLKKGGTISQVETFTDKSSFRVPLLKEEVVVVGYKQPGPGEIRSSNVTASGDRTLLKEECRRVVNQVSSREIPEWLDRDLEFALAIKFVIK